MNAIKRTWALATLLVAALAVTTVTSSSSQGNDDDWSRRFRDDGYAIGLWGDLPYNATQATIGVPNLIADMNRHKLAFTVHDGDLKSGSSECTDSVYTQGLGYFNSLE